MAAQILTVAVKKLMEFVGGISRLYQGVSPNYYANGAGTTAAAAGVEVDVATALGRFGVGGNIVNDDASLTVTVAIDTGTGSYDDDVHLKAGETLNLGDGHGLLISKIKLTESSDTAVCRIWVY